MLRSHVLGLSAALLPLFAAFPAATQAPQSKPAAPELAAVSDPAPALPEPAVQPARISLANGELTVQARNSELNQILQDVAHLTGMSLTGLTGNKHVYGVYGPADPRSVLTGLLEASGYNFLLVGGDSAPRQLILMPETKAPPTVAKAPNPQQDQDDSDDQYAQQDSTDPY